MYFKKTMLATVLMALIVNNPSNAASDCDTAQSASEQIRPVREWTPYSPNGYWPEAKKTPTPRSYSAAQVDAVVESKLLKINAPVAAFAGKNIPAACNNIQFVRHKVRGMPENSAAADAIIMFMPGIYEGANAFRYLARNLIYQAYNSGKNLEMWAIDRRSNCLEDLTGFQAAEQATTADEAKNIMLDYYYRNKAINGKKFAGFIGDKNFPGLAEFGIQVATEDMFTIAKNRIPDLATRQQKLFVGGHSLGGVHTSIFLEWDQDGNKKTIDDAGYNNVAGAIGLDTILGSISEVPAYINTLLPPATSGIFNSLPVLTPIIYKQWLKGMREGKMPTTGSIKNFFVPEIIALPEALGILASKDPNGVSTAVKEIPMSSALKNFTRVLHSRNAADFWFGPTFFDYRYSNSAVLAMFFDDQFTTLNLLAISVGSLHCGPMVKKQPGSQYLRTIPGLDKIITAVFLSQQGFIASDAGPDKKHLGQGRVYEWANFDEVANAADPLYQDRTKMVTFTKRESEMVDINDLAEALYAGDTNLTEWYFPARIYLDLSEIPYDYAPKIGLNVLHHEGEKQVPKLELVGSEGIVVPLLELGIIKPHGKHVLLPGANHLDPLLLVANAPAYPNLVISEILKFIANPKSAEYQHK